MYKLKKIFVMVLIAAVISLGSTGCKKKERTSNGGTSIH